MFLILVCCSLASYTAGTRIPRNSVSGSAFGFFAFQFNCLNFSALDMRIMVIHQWWIEKSRTIPHSKPKFFKKLNTGLKWSTLGKMFSKNGLSGQKEEQCLGNITSMSRTLSRKETIFKRWAFSHWWAHRLRLLVWVSIIEATASNEANGKPVLGSDALKWVTLQLQILANRIYIPSD